MAAISSDPHESQRCRRVARTGTANAASLEHAMLQHPGSFDTTPSRFNWKQPLEQISRWFLRLSKQLFSQQASDTPRLDRGWIIANHKLVFFHAAFLTSLLSIPLHVSSKFAVMQKMFLSVEVVIFSLMWYAAWRSGTRRLLRQMFSFLLHLIGPTLALCSARACLARTLLLPGREFLASMKA
jgi:hypothetical protein